MPHRKAVPMIININKNLGKENKQNHMFKMSCECSKLDKTSFKTILLLGTIVFLFFLVSDIYLYTMGAQTTTNRLAEGR